MSHRTTPRFWDGYDRLPTEVQSLADRAFEALKADPSHPSLNFKKIDSFWSARVGLHYRTLAIESRDGLTWAWIGTHAEYDRLIR